MNKIFEIKGKSTVATKVHDNTCELVYRDFQLKVEKLNVSGLKIDAYIGINKSKEMYLSDVNYVITFTVAYSRVTISRDGYFEPIIIHVDDYPR